MTFKSYTQFKQAKSAIVRATGIYSRTSRIKAEVNIDVYGSFDMKRALNAIRWASATGRLSAQAEAMLKELSGYKLADLVADIAVSKMFDADVPRYLNGTYAIKIK